MSISKNKIIIAGPCSAESREQVLDIALTLKQSLGGSLSFFRAGIWKPRTRPGSFEGLGALALTWLKEVQDQLDIPVAIEVARPNHVELALHYGIKGLWLGARTVVNPFLVQEIADAIRLSPPLTIMIKNPINVDLSLWLGAIERLEQSNPHHTIWAIHRGFSSLEKSKYRNNPQWKIPFELKRLRPDLKLICDPSHIAGKREYVEEIAQKALDLDFDGLMIESHNFPSRALSDADQQVTPEELDSMMKRLKVRYQNQNQNLDSALESKEQRLLELRHSIDQLDNQLLEILMMRKKIVEKIGKIKQEYNMTIFQMDRFQKMIQDRCEKGKNLDLSEDYVAALFANIHEESVKQQNLLS